MNPQTKPPIFEAWKITQAKIMKTPNNERTLILYHAFHFSVPTHMPFERIEPSSQLSDLAKMVCAVQLPVTRGHGGKKFFLTFPACF